VTNGRLVVDVPTDLPEGSEVELVAIEGATDEMAALSASSLAERQAVIAQRIARVRSGDTELLSVDEVERSIREELDV